VLHGGSPPSWSTGVYGDLPNRGNRYPIAEQRQARSVQDSPREPTANKQ
jgi:hypothetical protein